MIKNILFQNVCSDIQAKERRETSAHEQARDSSSALDVLHFVSHLGWQHQDELHPTSLAITLWSSAPKDMCVYLTKHKFGTQPESIWSVFVLISLAPGIRKPRGWDWPFTLPQHALSFPLLYLSLMRNEERALCLHLLYQSPPLWLCV